MQLASPPVVVHPVGQIAVLLRLEQNRARPDRVHRAGIHKKHFALGHWQHIQVRLEPSIMNSLLHLIECRIGLQPQRHLGARLGVKRVPALRFAARRAVLLRHPVIGMHLHAELLLREQHLQQQRRLGCRYARPQQRLVRFGKNLRQPLAGVWSARHQTIVAGQPHLAQRIAHSHLVIPGSQIAIPPNALAKARIDAKRR